MTKKQVASKKSGKGANAEAESSKPIMATANPQKFWKMEFIAERGFKTDKASDAFTATVATLGWEHFIKHRKKYMVSVVREFYARIEEPRDGNPQTYSTVRGETMNFNARTINDVFRLGYHGKELVNKVKAWGKEERRCKREDLRGRI